MYKRFTKLIIAIIFILLVIGSFCIMSYHLYQKSQKLDVKFATCSPVTLDIRKTVLVSGTIVPSEEIKIKPKVPGIIKNIYIKPGDYVKKNHILAKISVVPDQSLLNEGYNRYNKAKLTLLRAEQKLNRNKKTYNSKCISAEDFEKVNIEYQIATNELEAAKNNLKIIKEGSYNQNDNTNQTLVRSTISGTILEIPVKIGDTIIQSNTFNDGTTIAVVADMHSLIFEGDIDESDVGKIKEGMKLKLELRAIENKEINALLMYIAPKGNIENDGQVKFKIKASIERQEDIIIRAGYSANAKIVLAERKGVLAINEGCLKFDKRQKAYVELQTNNQGFERRDVKLGLSDSIYVEVLEGLSLNDKIKTNSMYLPN